MKKVFIAATEQGRVSGRILGAILKKEDKFQHCVELDICSISNRGVNAEVIIKLVEIGELPKDALHENGYPNYTLVNEIADIVVIDGRGLNYYSII
jgi:hypothetical protein